MLQELRDHSVFRLEQKQEPNKQRTQQQGSSGKLRSSSTLRNYRQVAYQSPSPRRYSPAAFSLRGSEESASLFLGNLPVDVTQQELVHIFGKYGSVLSAQVISKASPSSESLRLTQSSY